MKRLIILSLFAVSTLALSGCNRAWPRCWWFRGDECTGGYPAYETTPFVTEGIPMVPSATCVPEILPGPAATTPST